MSENTGYVLSDAAMEKAVRESRAISMLAEPALAELARLAAGCGGPIIELGPYIGGSTCALAAAPSGRVITVEIGGANPEHPQLPTDDTVADLNENLRKAGVSGRVTVVEGHFQQNKTLECVRQHLGDARAGLLFVDVTPGTEIAVQLYASLLRPHAVLVIDDYYSEYAVDKARQVKAFVDAAVASGITEEIGVFGWGTWFGRLAGGDAVERLRRLPVALPCQSAGGHAWHVFVGHDELSDDASGNASPLILCEDGRPLGPAHTPHQIIRDSGAGAFSHWRGGLYFSTSDNSSPLENGRAYSLLIGDTLIDLHSCAPLP